MHHVPVHRDAADRIGARPGVSSAAWAASFVSEVVSAVPYDITSLAERPQQHSLCMLRQPSTQPSQLATYADELVMRLAGDAGQLVATEQQQQEEPGPLHFTAHGLVWEVAPVQGPPCWPQACA